MNIKLNKLANDNVFQSISTINSFESKIYFIHLAASSIRDVKSTQAVNQVDRIDLLDFIQCDLMNPRAISPLLEFFYEIHSSLQSDPDAHIFLSTI